MFIHSIVVGGIMSHGINHHSRMCNLLIFFNDLKSRKSRGDNSGKASKLSSSNALLIFNSFKTYGFINSLYVILLATLSIYGSIGYLPYHSKLASFKIKCLIFIYSKSND